MPAGGGTTRKRLKKLGVKSRPATGGPASAPAAPRFRKPALPGTPKATRHARFIVQHRNVQARVGQQRQQATLQLGRRPRTAGQRRRAAARLQGQGDRLARILASYTPDVRAQLIAGHSPGLPNRGGIPSYAGPGITARQARILGIPSGGKTPSPIITPRGAERLKALGLGQRERAAAAKPDSLAGSLLNPIDLLVIGATGGTALGARALARGAVEAGARAAARGGAEAATEQIGRSGARTIAQAARRVPRLARAAVPQRADYRALRAAAYMRGTRAAGAAAALGVAGAGGQQALSAVPIDVAAHAAAFKQHPGRYIERSPGAAYGILAGLGSAVGNVGLSAKRLLLHQPHALDPAKQAAQVLIGGTVEAGKLYGSGNFQAVKKHAGEVGAGELLALGLPLGHAAELRPFRGAARRFVRTKAEAGRAARTARINQAIAEGRVPRRPGKVREALGLGEHRGARPPGAPPEYVFPATARYFKRKGEAEIASREAIFRSSVEARIAKKIMVPAIDKLRERFGHGEDLAAATSTLGLLAQKTWRGGDAAIQGLTRIVNRSSAEMLDTPGSQPWAAAWLLQHLHENPDFIKESGILEAVGAYKRAEQARANILQRQQLQSPRGRLVARHAAHKPIMFEYGIPEGEQRVEVPGGPGPTFQPPAKTIPSGKPGRPLDVLRAIDRVMNRPEQFIGKTKPGATEPSTVKLRSELEQEKTSAVSEVARLHAKADELYTEARLLSNQARKAPQARHVEYRAGRAAEIQTELKQLRRDRQKAERKAAKAAPAISHPTPRAREAPPEAPAAPAGQAAYVPPHLGGEWHPVELAAEGLAKGNYVRRYMHDATKKARKKGGVGDQFIDYEVVGITGKNYKLQVLTGDNAGATILVPHGVLEKRTGASKFWQRLASGPAPKAERAKLPAVAKEGALGEEKARISPNLDHAPDDLALYLRKITRNQKSYYDPNLGERVGIEDAMVEQVRHLTLDEASPDVRTFAYLSARDWLARRPEDRPAGDAEMFRRLEAGDTATEVQDFAYGVAKHYEEAHATGGEAAFTTPFDTTPTPKVEQPDFTGNVPVERPTYGKGQKHEESPMFTAPETQRGQTNLSDKELAAASEPKMPTGYATEKVMGAKGQPNRYRAYVKYEDGTRETVGEYDTAQEASDAAQRAELGKARTAAAAGSKLNPEFDKPGYVNPEGPRRPSMERRFGAGYTPDPAADVQAVQAQAKRLREEYWNGEKHHSKWATEPEFEEGAADALLGLRPRKLSGKRAEQARNRAYEAGYKRGTEARGEPDVRGYTPGQAAYDPTAKPEQTIDPATVGKGDKVRLNGEEWTVTKAGPKNVTLERAGGHKYPLSRDLLKKELARDVAKAEHEQLVERTRQEIARSMDPATGEIPQAERDRLRSLGNMGDEFPAIPMTHQRRGWDTNVINEFIQTDTESSSGYVVEKVRPRGWGKREADTPPDQFYVRDPKGNTVARFDKVDDARRYVEDNTPPASKDVIEARKSQDAMNAEVRKVAEEQKARLAPPAPEAAPTPAEQVPPAATPAGVEAAKPEPALAGADVAPAQAELAAIDARIGDLEAKLRDTLKRQAKVHVPTKDELRAEAASKRRLAKLHRQRAKRINNRVKEITGQLGKPIGEAEWQAAINDATVIRRAEDMGVPAWVHAEDAVKVMNEAFPQAHGGRRGSGSRLFRRKNTLEKQGTLDSSWDTVWAKSMSEPMDSASLERFHMESLKHLRVSPRKYTAQEAADAVRSGEVNPRYTIFVPDALTGALAEGRIAAVQAALAKMNLVTPHEPLKNLAEVDDAAREGSGTARKGEPTFTLWDLEGWKEYRAQLERQGKIEGFVAGLNHASAAAILATSLAWVPYQLIAEGAPLLAETSPHRWAKLSREYRKLPIRAQATFDAYHGSYGFGLGLGRSDVRLRLRPGMPELLKESSDIWHRTKFMRALAAHKNPLRFADQWKGEEFRNIMAVDETRVALNRLWKNMGDFAEYEQRILRDMQGRPFHEQVAWYTRHPDWMEEVGAKVKDMLGDWNTLTRRERNVAGLVFFYNMLRYTTRFVFWTFPKHHPVKAAIAYWLGQQNTNQIRKLLGGEPAYISALMQSLVFTGTDPNDPNQVLPVNLARASPAGQALVQAAFRGPFNASTLGIIQPAFSMVDSAIRGVDPYTGRQILPEQAVQGNGYIIQPDASGKAHRDLGGSQKAALFLAETLRLPGIVRNLEDIAAGGREVNRLPFTGPRNRDNQRSQFGRFYKWATPSAKERAGLSVIPGKSQPLIKQRALQQMQESLDQITLAQKASRSSYYSRPENRELARKIVKQATLAQRRVNELLRLPAKHGR